MKQNFLRASVSAQLNFSIMAKRAKYKNNQQNKGTIKFHGYKNAGAKYNATAKLHEKIGSSF